MIKKLLVPIMLSVMLTSCARATEPDDLAYVVAIGIDSKGDTKNFTLQIANPIKISGGSSEQGGEDGKDTVSAISVEADNIYQAVNVANHLYSKELNLSHTKLILISDKIAEGEGLSEFSEFLSRTEEIRPNTYISIVKGDAKKYLEEVKPTNEVNPVKYYEVIFDSAYTSFIPKSSAWEFYCYASSPERQQVLPLSAVKEDNSKGTQNQKNKGFEDGMPEIKAGEIKTESEIKTETAGIAIFKDGKMIASAGAKEAEIYNIVSGSYTKSEVSYPDKGSRDNEIAVMQTLAKKPVIKVDISGEIPRIYVGLNFEADLRTVSEAYMIEADIENFEEQTEIAIKEAVKSFLYKTSTEYKSDIVGFGSYVKRKFSSFDDFEKYDWQEKYENAEFNVEVDFKLRRSGLINRKRG
ncbi:MAG: Ger(x)C family spore germination protein [Clostridia bacterium]|nr:Ger(x)C family spore germination protein [Clostridia bacterium]